MSVKTPLARNALYSIVALTFALDNFFVLVALSGDDWYINSDSLLFAVLSQSRKVIVYKAWFDSSDRGVLDPVFNYFTKFG